MPNDTIESIEELRERLEETQASIDRAEAEQAKAEFLAEGGDPDVEDMLTTAGIDDFFVDDKGQILIGNEVVGGKEQPLDDVDSMNDERNPNAFLSPAERARLHLPGGRDSQGRYTPQSEEPDPRAWSQPCDECGDVADINRVDPIGLSMDTESGQHFVRYNCKCGCQRETVIDQMSEGAQARAVAETELLDTIIEHHMERPPRD